MHSPIIMVDGNKLRSYRREFGWTQNQLAKASGFTVRLIGKAESSGNIKMSTLRTLVTCLQAAQPDRFLSPHQFIQGENDCDVLSLTRNWFQVVFNERRVDQIAELVTDDVILHSEGVTRRGVGVIQERVGAILAAFEPLELHIERCVREANTAVAYWRVRKRHVGEFAGIAPTGNWVFIRGSSMADFEGERIAEARDHFDVDDLIRQLKGYDAKPI